MKKTREFYFYDHRHNHAYKVDAVSPDEAKKKIEKKLTGTFFELPEDVLPNVVMADQLIEVEMLNEWVQRKEYPNMGEDFT